MKNDRLIINYEIDFILSLHRSQSKKLYMQILYFKSKSTNFVCLPYGELHNFVCRTPFILKRNSLKL